MRKSRRRETFKQLEARWYRRLKDEGFDDIEDTSRPERPLKSWHSFRFGGRRWNGRGNNYDPTHIPSTQEYYRLATLFLAVSMAMRHSRPYEYMDEGLPNFSVR